MSSRRSSRSRLGRVGFSCSQTRTLDSIHELTQRTDFSSSYSFCSLAGRRIMMLIIFNTTLSNGRSQQVRPGMSLSALLFCLCCCCCCLQCCSFFTCFQLDPVNSDHTQILQTFPRQQQTCGHNRWGAGRGRSWELATAKRRAGKERKNN